MNIQLKLFCDVTQPHKNSAVPHLNSVLVEPKAISTYDIESHTTYKTDSQSEQNVLLDAEELKAKIGILKADLSNIKTLPLEEYPVPPFFTEPVRTVAVGRERFVQEFKTIKEHISCDDTKQFLQGVCITKDGKMVSTNGFSLAAVDVIPADLNSKFDFIIPAGAMATLERILKKDNSTKSVKEIVFQVDGGARQLIKISIGDWVIISRAVAGRFPDYRCVLPKNRGAHCVEFDAQDFVKQLKKLQPIAKETTNVVRIEQDRLTVQLPYPKEIRDALKKDKSFKLPNPEYETIDSQITNSLSEPVAFNIRILLYCLKNMKGAVQMRGNGPLSPWVIEHGGITQIIMPIRTEGPSC